MHRTEVAYAAFLPLWFALSIAATMGLANTPEWWALPALLAVWVYPVVAILAVVLVRPAGRRLASSPPG